jgi:predicted porin
MIGIGHELGKNMATHLRYGYHKAKEVPMDNDNVKVNNVSLDLVYKF